MLLHSKSWLRDHSQGTLFRSLSLSPLVSLSGIPPSLSAKHDFQFSSNEAFCETLMRSLSAWRTWGSLYSTKTHFRIMPICHTFQMHRLVFEILVRRTVEPPQIRPEPIRSNNKKQQETTRNNNDSNTQQDQDRQPIFAGATQPPTTPNDRLLLVDTPRGVTRRNETNKARRPKETYKNENTKRKRNSAREKERSETTTTTTTMMMVSTAKGFGLAALLLLGSLSNAAGDLFRSRVSEDRGRYRMQLLPSSLSRNHSQPIRFAIRFVVHPHRQRLSGSTSVVIQQLQGELGMLETDSEEYERVKAVCIERSLARRDTVLQRRRHGLCPTLL